MKNLGLIISLIFVAMVLLIATVAVSSYISYANYGNRMETLIDQTYKNNQNILAQYGQQVAEAAQVPDMYRDDIIKTTQAAISGRYGADGSKAVFQMLKEDNPKLDPMLYRQIQQIIESKRNNFQESQTRLLDIEREYKVSLGNIWSGLWLHIAGYPKNYSDEKYKMITTDYAEKTFETGKETSPMKIRP